jgi:hypothetical protein
MKLRSNTILDVTRWCNQRGVTRGRPVPPRPGHFLSTQLTRGRCRNAAYRWLLADVGTESGAFSFVTGEGRKEPTGPVNSSLDPSS